ncbi:LuxR C-terminal-related transcriptional regulator [Paremcibacter congregatus]|uniref:LuxR C-terminal-related transcriptional regulator n=1 Tax=Paremcibacter congregatus TaxID=2043170 RepID=UPI0030EDC2D2|tara:strand:+ start:113 stop:982 length:870 start_codon:yes stop_codon:yes gene_type:complete
MTKNSISGNSPVGDAMTGSDEWLARLNAAIGTLGRDDFEDRLFALVNGAVRVDHCAVFIHNRDGTTAHLFTKSMLDAATCQNLTQAYTEQFHARDPNLTGAPATEDARVTLLPHTPTSAYDAEYQARFFEATGLIDKMSSLLRRREYTIYCSFYRLRDSGCFSVAEGDALSRILPLLTNLIFKHARLLGAAEKETALDPIITQVPLSRSPDAMTNLLAGESDVFGRLTDRERQVCGRILQGYSSEAISLELKVAKSTIHTYRKRAYAKLGISSQNELFSLCLEMLPGRG